MKLPWAQTHFFWGDERCVPLDHPAARHILSLASGADKAEALKAVLAGPVNGKRWPAQRIRPEQGTVTGFIDEAAARSLRSADR